MNRGDQNRRDWARSMGEMQRAQFAVEPYTTKRPERRERAATAEKRERRAIYGKYDPALGTCSDCHMILAANGECTGCS